MRTDDRTAPRSTEPATGPDAAGTIVAWLIEAGVARAAEASSRGWTATAEVRDGRAPWDLVAVTHSQPSQNHRGADRGRRDRYGASPSSMTSGFRRLRGPSGRRPLPRYANVVRSRLPALRPAVRARRLWRRFRRGLVGYGTGPRPAARPRRPGRARAPGCVRGRRRLERWRRHPAAARAPAAPAHRAGCRGRPGRVHAVPAPGRRRRCRGTGAADPGGRRRGHDRRGLAHRAGRPRRARA